MTTTDRHPHPGDRYTGQPITPELLRAEATRLDATNAGGAASWIMGEVACLLRRTADQLPPVEPDRCPKCPPSGWCGVCGHDPDDDPMADWPAPDAGTPTVWEQCRRWDQEVNGR
jgi:hypothetical protein